MTPDEINALPKRVRDYIHEIETRADPAFEVQQRWALIEQRDGLVVRVRELEAELAAVKRKG
ncbi:hypothetical protein [Sphingomonas sp. URHD0057]|uniref:hypothetical protein n=1 Tax=Sphingomonas sp. URHD0057 TaxID=1380389 RepID=UPI00048E1E7C|nr:hypothetical protein [Sphingomonas sp. URHD0057]